MSTRTCEENIEEVIAKYKAGQSFNSIAKEYDTHANLVRRVLINHGVELRKDSFQKGVLQVKGEELLEWVKSQGRLVTKNEMAAFLGLHKLTPSYLIKYPELNHYMKNNRQCVLSEYTDKLFNWLQENNIPYKACDRTKLQVAVDALLLGDYTGLAIHNCVKPYHMSKVNHANAINTKIQRANAHGVELLLLNEEDFDNLDSVIKPWLKLNLK